MNPARRLQELLGSSHPPVAVTFIDHAPAGVPHVAAAGPASCSYWKLAAEGRTFFTEAADHANCPIGAYTHGVPLTPEVMKDLQGTVETMVGLSYLRAEEVPAIPRREGAFGVAVYQPLQETTTEPSAVIVRGNARQIMMLAEAALAAGAASSGLMGRPTCAMLPAAMRSGQGVASLGCIGNRVYTELGDGELYFALPGNKVQAVMEKLAGIVRANSELEKYHKGKLSDRGGKS
jgi:uncharacterized protein (DUF169 family)